MVLKHLTLYPHLNTLSEGTRSEGFVWIINVFFITWPCRINYWPNLPFSTRFPARLLPRLSHPSPVAPPFFFPSPEDASPQGHHRSVSGYAPSTSTPAGYGIQFPSTPGRPSTPLSSPRSPFPDWATSIFRSSTGGGGGLDSEGFSAERGEEERTPASPRFNGTPARTRQLRRAASTSWW